MAKDAKGHGSDKRGGGGDGKNFPITLIGDPGHAAAQAATVSRLLGSVNAGGDQHPKSGGVPVHGGMNIDRNLRGPGKHVGYGGGESYHIQKTNGPKSNWYSAVGQRSGKVISGKGLGEISRKLPK